MPCPQQFSPRWSSCCPSSSLLSEGFRIDGGWTLSAYTGFFSESLNRTVFLRTLRLGLEVTAVSAVIGYAAAFAIVNLPPKGKGRMIGLVTLPLMISPVARTYAWIVILGRTGIVNEAITGLGLSDSPLRLLFTETAVFIGLLQLFLPLMILSLISALENMPKDAIPAARVLGANWFQVFWKVILPLTREGLVVGGTLVFTGSLTAYITPAVLGGSKVLMLETLLYQQVSVANNFVAASVIAFMLIVMSFAANILLEAPCHGEEQAMTARILSPLVLGLLLIFLIGPFLIIIAASLSAGDTLAFPPQGLSLQWVSKVFTIDSFRDSFAMSMFLAVCGTLSALILGIPAAYALSRYKLPFGETVRTIVSLPIIVPGIIVGLALLRYLVVPFGFNITLALFLAHTALVLPYAVRVVSASLNNLRSDIEEAAVLLGSSRARRLLPRRHAEYPRRHPRRLHSRLRHQLQSGARLALPVRPRRAHAADRHAGLHGNHLRSVDRCALLAARLPLHRHRLPCRTLPGILSLCLTAIFNSTS